MNRLLNWLINYEFTDIEWGIFGAAQKYAILEEKQKSLDCLEKAFEMRTPNLPKINYYSEFKILRNEPRFQALLDSMNLTPYQSKEINSTVIKK